MTEPLSWESAMHSSAAGCIDDPDVLWAPVKYADMPAAQDIGTRDFIAFYRRHVGMRLSVLYDKRQYSASTDLVETVFDVYAAESNYVETEEGIVRGGARLRSVVNYFRWLSRVARYPSDSTLTLAARIAECLDRRREVLWARRAKRWGARRAGVRMGIPFRVRLTQIWARIKRAMPKATDYGPFVAAIILRLGKGAWRARGIPATGLYRVGDDAYYLSHLPAHLAARKRYLRLDGVAGAPCSMRLSKQAYDRLRYLRANKDPYYLFSDGDGQMSYYELINQAYAALSDAGAFPIRTEGARSERLRRVYKLVRARVKRLRNAKVVGRVTRRATPPSLPALCWGRVRRFATAKRKLWRCVDAAFWAASGDYGDWLADFTEKNDGEKNWRRQTPHPTPDISQFTIT